jgi:hypothetical protein
MIYSGDRVELRASMEAVWIDQSSTRLRTGGFFFESGFYSAQRSNEVQGGHILLYPPECQSLLSPGRQLMLNLVVLGLEAAFR